jgi:RHS repeat-associated protein
MATDSQLPAIRTFQFDSTNLGDLPSSVNLFRGDINLQQVLFSMPGRRTDDGLDVTVTLLYQSNVYRDAMTWNRDAPTGILGLGWSLSASSITLDDGGSPSPGLWQYSYVSGGSSTPLAREPETPRLFSMSAALASSLVDGQSVPASILGEFVSRGVALSADARVQAVSDTEWTLADDTAQQLFNLALTDTALTAFDGGESYQLVDYRFWKILYYPPYERWVLTNEAGQRMSYGGLSAPTSQGYATSTGNSVEWGVRWGASGSQDSDSPAVWVGPSTLASGQRQYARAWHLATVSTAWGDSLSYGYNEWTRDPSTGLLPEVEQLVGASGLPYTKACYLTGITDVFGRKAVFQYEDKAWSDATPESPREYADPHKATPSTEPNAYQDRYETKSLHCITVHDLDDAPLFSQTFIYAPETKQPESALGVANVTSYTGSLQGDTYKRFLTGVEFSNADGDSLPGLVFDYYFDGSRSGASPGALWTATYPQGGTATYTYTSQSLTVCDRTQTVPPPEGIPAGAHPRVFYGSDYAVTTWYDPLQGQLSLQVYTWVGRWESWELDSGALLFKDSNGLDLSTLNVIANDEYFALSFQRTGLTDVYVFRKDISRPGQWVPSAVNGVQTGFNTPTRSYTRNSGTVTLVGGSSFLLAVSNDYLTPSYTSERLTWRWTEAAWTLESFTLPQYTYATAANEYYLLVDVTGAVSLFSLDPTLVWSPAETLTLAGFQVSAYTNVALAPSASFVALSNLTNQNSQTLGYTLSIVSWDTDYQLQPVSSMSFTDRQEPSGAYLTSWAPVVVSNTLIACGAHVLRFNGQSWLENSGLYPSNPDSGSEQRYAYGPDSALQIVLGSTGTPSAQVLSFDPDADCSDWERGPVTPAQTLTAPTQDAGTANWPAAGGTDFLTLGQYLYSRGTATSWDGVVAQAPDADLQALVNQALGATGRYILNSQAVVGEEPDFLAYYVYDTQSVTGARAAAVILKNGGVYGSAETFSSERIFSASETGAVDPGEFPGGPGAFTGYPSTDPDFDHATRLILHRYAGDGVDGPLVHYAVSGLTLDNGFGDPIPTSYFFDPAQAACDPTGLVVKYYTSTVYPGTQDPASPPYGPSVNTYLNGLGILTGADYCGMLDGLLESVEVFDSQGNSLSKTTNGWQVYPVRAGVPDGGTVPALNLKGGFVCQTSQTKVEDGVTSTQSTSYVPDGFPAPCSSQPASTVQTTYGGSGTQETFTTTTAYAWQLYDSLSALHMIQQVAQSIVTSTRGQGSPVTVTAFAKTYTGFPSAVGGAVSVPAEEAEFGWLGTSSSSTFPFSSYTPGSVPGGWLRRSRITGRTSLGLVEELEDGNGIVSSVMHGGDQTFPLARFTNASVSGGECVYSGFETYEDTGGWIAMGTSLVTGDAHTGSQSLSLPGGGIASLSAKLTPANVSQTYVLGYAYKTPAGFTSADGTGFSITVSVDGTVASTQTSSFEDTEGQWLFQTVGIPFQAGQQSVELSLQAGNTSLSPVLLDNVFAAPRVSTLSVQTFDTRYHLVTSTLDSGGRVMRASFDRFQRALASVGADGQPKHLCQTFLSGQGNAGGTFDATSPNANLVLHPASGGALETFLTGDEWQSRWQASGLPGNWSVAPGALRHVGTVSDTLTWRGFDGSTPATAALFLEVQPPETLSGSFGVTFAQGYQLLYSAQGGYAFTDPTGAPVQQPLASPPDMARQWLLVLGDGVILFFGDGQLLFSAPVAWTDLGTVSLSTGPNTLTLRNLALLAEPRLGVTYQDAAGRDRQMQQLHGGDARISAVIYDALDHKVAITRSAPASFGASASQPLLSYRSSFADIEGFLASMSDSWTLTGDVADYYQGQQDGPVTRSDDEGYPYHGYRFEASPRNRQLELGQPGKDYAIHDVGSSTPRDRETFQLAYGANTGSEFNLPEGDYFTQTTISPVKTQATSIQDSTGRKVGSWISDASGTVAAQGSAQATFSAAAPGAASTLNTLQPNSFTNGPQSDPPAFVSVLTKDPLGRVSQRSDPDTGTTSFLYDAASHLRFAAPALDEGQTGFVYYKYDALGRLLEEGTVTQAWDAAQLTPLANQPDWPDTSVAHTVARTHAYDGTGDDPSQLGRKISVTTANPAPSSLPSASDATVTETFTYDAPGRIVSVAMSLEGAASANGVVTYSYNNLNQLLQVTYPDGSPLPLVVYTYDDQGCVTGIGSSAGTPTDLAAYTYTADGEVSVEALNQGQLQATYAYNSPGWLLQYTVTARGATQPCFSQALEYVADGAIQNRTTTSTLSSSDSTQVVFTYDAQRQLVDASVADGGQGNESISSYDANGNIWSLTQDGVSYASSCGAGTNQVDSFTVGSGTATSLQYSADGRLLQNGNLSLGYDACLGLTTSLVVAGDSPVQVRLAYGGQSQRVLKQVGDAGAPRISFRGSGLQPLLQQQVGGTATAFVYGPTGLVTVVSDQRYFPLKDHNQTVWAVVDARDTLVARYDYRPFGSLVAASGSQPEVLAFRFMGKEWDAETGLYDFGARLYDPNLRRFCSPDPARQYASAYLFAGNNPVMMVDPTGKMSTWGRVGVGVGMGTLAAVGLILSFFTFGTSDLLSLGTLGGLLGPGEEAAGGGGATSLLGGGGGGGATVTSSVSSAGVGEADLGAGVGTGAEQAATSQTVQIQALAANSAQGSATTVSSASAQGSSTLGLKLANMGWQVLTNTAFGVGASGLQYDIKPGGNFTGHGFGQALLSGVWSGMLYGVGSGLMGLPEVKTLLEGFTPLTRTALKVAANAVLGGITSDVSQLLMNATDHQPLYKGLAMAAGIGAAEGGVLWGLGEPGMETLAEQARDFGPAVKARLDAGSKCVDNALTQARQAVSGLSSRLSMANLSQDFEVLPDLPSIQ